MKDMFDSAATVELMRETMSYGDLAGLIWLSYGLGTPGIKGTTVTASVQYESTEL
jgi:hypothetical protein